MAADVSQTSRTSEFIFCDVNLIMDNKHIIRNVSGTVEKGELLAILGPKGAGKSALVHILAGKIKPYLGELMLNDIPTSKCHREIAFVESRDLFLPTLTLYEILWYNAKLRLVTTCTKDLETNIKQVITLLHLDDYVNIMTQILTPAIKKRLSIACEMITDPKVLIIDEPINEFDYDEALILMRKLSGYMKQNGKMGIVSLRACASGIYQTCSKYLFLYNGRPEFYGTSEQCEDLLQQLGTPLPQGYHPMDYILELLNEDVFTGQIQSQSTQLIENQRKRSVSEWPVHFHLRRVASLKSARSTTSDDNNHMEIAKYDSNTISIKIEQPRITNTSTEYLSPYNTSFCHQFWALFRRNFTNARRRILFPISILQNLYILAICVLVWWQPERTEENVQGTQGLFFFTVVQWAFFALLDSILTFPKEIKIINKERKNKHFRLSAYCLSKCFSEIPLTVLQPCVYLSVIYWVANLNDVTSFLSSIGVLMLDVLAAQSIGLFIGTALRPPWTVTMVPLGLLSMMLVGGGFNTPPSWFRWGRFASFFFYGLNALIYLEYKDAAPIRCGQSSVIPKCTEIDPETNTTFTHYDSNDVLKVSNVEWDFFYYVIVLVGILCLSLFLWYIAMRRRKSDE